MALSSAKATLRERITKILRSVDNGEKIRQSESVFKKVKFKKILQNSTLLTWCGI